MVVALCLYPRAVRAQRLEVGNLADVLALMNPKENIFYMVFTN